MEDDSPRQRRGIICIKITYLTNFLGTHFVLIPYWNVKNSGYLDGEKKYYLYSLPQDFLSIRKPSTHNHNLNALAAKSINT